MDTIHILNANPGSCNIIQHKTGNTTVIDICNGNSNDIERKVFANYKQKLYPTNPIDYLNQLGIQEIFRFILTHPDMDHMDGIKALFQCFRIYNFWDTNNNKEISETHDFGRYKKGDWEYYFNILRSSLENPKWQYRLAGEKAPLFNLNDDYEAGGDGLHILAPTQELQSKANRSGNYNISSYVLLYKSYGRKIVFAGDSEEETWNSILQQYESDVSNLDILIAPHHGRKSGGNANYLDILKPKLSILGNAASQELNYDDFNNRRLTHITHNEANNILITSDENNMIVYCVNESFAKDKNKLTVLNEKTKAWSLGFIKGDRYSYGNLR